jgi:Rod binding domain-containing protein
VDVSLNIAAGMTVPKAPPPGDSPEKIKSAAQQFEAMLIGQMMKSSHGPGGWMGTEDESSSALGDMAEQQFAQLLASNGGMGLAKLVSLGLKGKSDSGSGEVPGENRKQIAVGGPGKTDSIEKD